MLQRAKLLNKLASADIGALISVTPGLWLWRNLPVPVWKRSSVRFSKRLCLCCARNQHKEYYWPQFSGPNPMLRVSPYSTGCSTPLISLWYFTWSVCSHLSCTLCKVLFQKQNFCASLCVQTAQLVMIVSSQLLSLTLHRPTGTLIKELCTVMTRIDFQFPVEWLYHCLWLRQFSLYYSAVWGL